MKEDAHKHPEKIVRKFERDLWQIVPFIKGSRSNDAPRETLFALKLALSEWVSNPVLISSSSLEELDFFLSPLDLWATVKKYFPDLTNEDYRPFVARIGSPIAYKHRPLFCTPLFHELGHFLDISLGLTELSLIMNPIDIVPSGLNEAQFREITLNHRREYFADLFSACYCGEIAAKSLHELAPDHSASNTHPATKDRIQNINEFLTKGTNKNVEMFNSALEARKLDKLSTRFSTPNLNVAFDDFVPYQISSKEELFGIYISGWNYLFDKLKGGTGKWGELEVTDFEIEKTVNDLTEKSIRNFEIRERWKNGSAD